MPRKYLVLLVVLIALIGGGMFLLRDTSEVPEPEGENTIEPVGPPAWKPSITSEVIGVSVEGRDIVAHQFGNAITGPSLLFVGGIHGGYEWNSVLLAYEFIDYFTDNLQAIPENTAIHIIPSLNPDGLFAVIGTSSRFALADAPIDRDVTVPGRFNANGVDLNRNFDCKWQPESTWRGNVVSAGTGPFSEPEAAALRDYVLAHTPDAVVFWHSQANNVYASECENGVHPDTIAIMNAYAKAGQYGAVESFDAYPITGDAEGWLASINIPAITVELESYKDIEWERNLAGVEALLDFYSFK